MSRSFKKHPYCLWVCMSAREVKSIKRMANRRYRHKLNRGDYDDCVGLLQLHKRTEDCAWTYDLGKQYLHKKDFTTEQFRKLVKK